IGILALAFGPVDDLHSAVSVLDERGAALHPVAVVIVSYIPNLPDFRRMDVAADNALRAALVGRMRDHFLEARDELDRVLDLLLEVSSERPIRQPALAADPVEDAVELKQQRVGIVAQEGEPLGVEHHAVEFVTVED